MYKSLRTYFVLQRQTGGSVRKDSRNLSSLICFDQCGLGWGIGQIKFIPTAALVRLSDTDLSVKLPEVQILLLNLCGETDI